MSEYTEIDEYEGPEPSLNGMIDNSRRPPPESGLDFNMQMVEPDFSKEEITPALKDRLTKVIRRVKLQDGTIQEEKEFLWNRLNFYTKDMRLGNLKPTELEFCRYFLGLANGFIALEEQEEATVFCIGEFARVAETSQSRDGFLRKRQGTITSERINREYEPGKKNFFTGKAPQE